MAVTTYILTVGPIVTAYALYLRARRAK